MSTGMALGGLPWIEGGVAVAGACAMLSAWLVLGWDRRDMRETCARWRVRATEACERVWGALGRLAWKTGLGGGSVAYECADVGLGQVSEMIDIVRLGLRAGLSFDAALGLYCEGRSGVLSEQLACARLSWQAGLGTREQGLLLVARATGLHALESFAIAVSQALELGAPLADTLEGQGREIRAAHRAEVERQIERAPVKLLIPTGTLILPALLLSIVGPLVAAGGLM